MNLRDKSVSLSIKQIVEEFHFLYASQQLFEMKYYEKNVKSI